MNADMRNTPALGLDQSVVAALMQLYVAGQRAEDGHMPQLLTANGVRVAIEPGAGVVNLAYRDLTCELSPAQAYELATMITAAADALRHLSGSNTSALGHEAVLSSLSRLSADEAPSTR